MSSTHAAARVAVAELCVAQREVEPLVVAGHALGIGELAEKVVLLGLPRGGDRAEAQGFEFAPGSGA